MNGMGKISDIGMEILIEDFNDRLEKEFLRKISIVSLYGRIDL